MKLFFPTDPNKPGVIITSPLGNIEGGTLLHYRIAVLLTESGKVISDTFGLKHPEGRTMVVKLEEEKEEEEAQREEEPYMGHDGFMA